MKDLLNYYQARQEPGKLFGRSQLEPGDIPDILPHLALLSVEPGLLKIRLIGTLLVERFGFDLTGKNLLDFLPPDLGGKYENLFTEALGRKFGALATYELPRAHLPPLEIEMILLPMSDREGRENLIMFAIGYISDEVRHEGFGGDLTAPGLKSLLGIDLGFGLPDLVGKVGDGDWFNTPGKAGKKAGARTE
ncbi:MAG: PAS domain-containing protein [Sphingomonadales bacterium]